MWLELWASNHSPGTCRNVWLSNASYCVCTGTSVAWTWLLISLHLSYLAKTFPPYPLQPIGCKQAWDRVWLKNGGQVPAEIQTPNSVLFPNQNKKPSTQNFSCITIIPAQFQIWKKLQPFILLVAKLYHTISVITTTSSNIFSSACNLIRICNEKIILKCFDKKDRKLKCFVEVFSCYYCHTPVLTWLVFWWKPLSPISFPRQVYSLCACQPSNNGLWSKLHM